MSAITWSRLNTLTFIDLLKQHQELWNIEHPDFKNRAIKEEAISEMLQELQKKIPEAEISDVKSKIHTLRSQYRRQIRDTEKARQRGYESNGKTPRLWCFEELKFFGYNDSPPNKRVNREAEQEIKCEVSDIAADEETELAEFEPHVANEPVDDSVEKVPTLEARNIKIKLKRLAIDKRRNEIAAQQLEQTKRRNSIQSEILAEKRKRNAIEREKVAVMMRLENIFSDILEKISANSNYL